MPRGICGGAIGAERSEPYDHVKAAAPGGANVEVCIAAKKMGASMRTAAHQSWNLDISVTFVVRWGHS